MIKPKRQYHVHPPLLLYCGVSLLVAVGAFHAQNNLLFWVFGLSMGMVIVSGIISGWMLMSVSVRREAIDATQVGEAMRVRYEVRNTSRFIALHCLTIRELIDETPEARGGGSRTGAGAMAVQRGRLETAATAFVLHVGPGQVVRVEAEGLAVERGVVRSKGYMVTSSFPFGIIRKALRWDIAGDGIVRPAAEAVALVPPRRGEVKRQQDARSSNDPGPGDDFLSLREYREGDPPRAIAWRLSARHDQLRVRLSSQEATGQRWIMLRLEAMSGAAGRAEDRAGELRRKRGERAISMAAGLLTRSIDDGVRVGLVIVGTGLSMPPRDGPAHLHAMLNALAMQRLDDPRLGGPEDRRTMGPRSGDHVMVVHAGPVDSSVWPGAVHLAAGREVADGEEESGGGSGTAANGDTGRKPMQRIRRLWRKAVAS